MGGSRTQLGDNQTTELEVAWPAPFLTSTLFRMDELGLRFFFIRLSPNEYFKTSADPILCRPLPQSDRTFPRG